MSYFTQIRSSQGYPGTILDSAEPLFDSSNNIFYIGTEIGSAPIPYYPYVNIDPSTKIVDGLLYVYDASRGKYLSNRMTLAGARNGAPGGTDCYFKNGDATASSTTGFKMVRNGTITGLSVTNTTIVTANRNIEARVNDSSTNKVRLVLLNGNKGAYLNNGNQDFVEGDVIQLIALSGASGGVMYDAFATVEIALRL